MEHAPRKRRLMGEINVVPLIDVMLVLLVIFMATAPLLTQGVKVELPKADAEPLPAHLASPSHRWCCPSTGRQDCSSTSAARPMRRWTTTQLLEAVTARTEAAHRSATC